MNPYQQAIARIIELEDKMDNQDLTMERRRKAKDKLIAELLEALEDVAEWIENGEWWVGSPFKGGLDGDAIDEAIRKAKGE